MGETATEGKWRDNAIWFFAFGYFACYAPYSALTKGLTKGLFPSMERPFTGFELLPASVMMSVVGMFTFLTVMRWWRFATRGRIFGIEVPRPTPFTFMSGLCTAGIIGTTTLAYTFDGVSIVFVMLLMRGGVLIIAPIVDALAKRKTRWFSWMGLALSLSALVVAFSEEGGYDITLVCGMDIALYLTSYFIRFRFMSRFAKSEDEDTNKRYFVEEQMIASPALLVLLAIFAVIDAGPLMHDVHEGFTTFWSRPIWPEALLVGLLSQGTGIFGSLVYLDKRENTYCVPVNRSSSILAGVLASYSLTFLLGQPPPSTHQLVGAGLIICAILFLSIPPALEKRRAAQLATSKATV